MRYIPASIDGLKVKQLVQLPVEFALTNAAAAAATGRTIRRLGDVVVTARADVPSHGHIFRLPVIVTRANRVPTAAPSTTASDNTASDNTASDNTAIFESQVDRQAAGQPRNPAPHYPDALRSLA